MLKPVIWADAYKVGDALIDHQHEAMFNAYNSVAALANIRRELTTYDIIATFNRMRFLAKVHFRDEERIMEERAFPGIEAHRRRHEEFTSAMLNLDNESYDIRSALLSIERFMKIWTEHIQNDDKAIFTKAPDRDRSMVAGPPGGDP